MSKIRVVVIGAGWVTLNRHIPWLRDNPKFEIAGVIDRHPERAKDAARRFRIPRHAAAVDFHAVPWQHETDAVLVGTSPMSHFNVIRSALLQGKHVLTEKPFTLTVEEGEDLVRLANQSQRVLMVNHNFQFSDSAMKLWADLREERLGKITAISGVQWSNPARRLPSWYPELPLGLFYDESPHLLYLLCRAAGESSPEFVSADVLAGIPPEKTPRRIEVRYRCGTGGQEIPATLEMFFKAPLSEWHLTVFGDKAMADVDIFRDIYIRLPNDQNHTAGHVIGTSVQAAWQHGIQTVIQGAKYLSGKLDYGNAKVFDYFADAILTGRVLPEISAETAVRIMKMQHQIFEMQRSFFPEMIQAGSRE